VNVIESQPQFVFQFHPLEIAELVDRYSSSEDPAALDAGRQVAAGRYDRNTINTMVKWKSPRRPALLDSDTDFEIATAPQFAAAPNTPEAMAVAVLTALHGVGISMASAILTTIHPGRYTVLDFRALEALGVKNWPDSFNFYIRSLKACRELAKAHGKSRRDLDRALWQWSWEQKQKK
jgi:hypothetical protein